MLKVTVKTTREGKTTTKCYEAESFEFGKSNGLDAIGFVKVGKNRKTWELIEVTDYMKEKYGISGSVTIEENGKMVGKFTF